MKTVFFIADCDVRINQQIAVGLMSELQKYGPWQLYMHDWKGRDLAPDRLRRALQATSPQAIVIHAPRLRSKVPAMWRSASIPWVVVGLDWLPHAPLPAVVPDNEAIGALAADYLLARRFDHFAMVGFRETVNLPRFNAFRDAVTRARKTLDGFTLQTHYGQGRWPRTASAAGHEAKLVGWLRQLPKPCALFAYSDNPAAHVVRMCAKHGIRVPDEVSVLGVDDDALFCHSVYPNLTSIHVANARIGTEAARLILDWRPGRRLLTSPPRTVMERGSVRGPQVKDHLVKRALTHLRSHVEEGVRVRDLQALTGLTPQVLVYRFRDAIGSTPMEEILHHRIVLARRLLTETQERVGAIAGQCGFNSATQFYVTFRRQTGMSPREYRTQFGGS